MTAPLGAWLAYTLKDWRLKAVAWGATLLMCGACLVTFSRGAWLGMAVAILLFALLVDRRLLILMLGAAVVAVFIPQVSDRLTFLFTADFAARTMTGGRGERWLVGMNLLQSSNEWLGLGLGRFGGAVAMRHQTLENVEYFYLDNYYLKVLVETGYLGLGGFVLLLGGMATSGLRNLLRLAKTKEQLLAAAVFSGLCGVLAHCFFENIFEVPYMTAYFWGLAALLVTLRARKTV
jgi:O-antigen ligase